LRNINHTLRWRATGARSSNLTYEIWYTPNETDLYHIASNIKGRKYKIDSNKFPGSLSGRFIIYATDGVRTGKAISPRLRIPFKAPEIRYVQTEIPEFKLTEEIRFNPQAYDMQDGWLDGSNVRWSLNHWEYSFGSTLWIWPYELPPGTYTFQCNAVNSVLIGAQKEFTFRIIDDESALPGDWSQEDIRFALSMGFVLPLDRLDLPVTRRDFARFMGEMYNTAITQEQEQVYGFVPDYFNPWPEYADGLVIDCAGENHYPSVMVSLGLMEAPGGRFNPNMPLTEKEGALLMYRTVVSPLKDLRSLPNANDETAIIEFLMNNNVLHESGPNAFDPEGLLTNRLALVRIAQMFTNESRDEWETRVFQ